MRRFTRALRRRQRTEAELEEEKSRLAELIMGRIEAAARNQINSDRAVLKKTTVCDGDPVFLLEPTNPSAAPLEAHVDSGRSVYLLPGRNEMTYEVYSRDAREQLEDVWLLTRAVVQGSYRERVRRRSPDEGDVQVIAKWPGPHQTVSARYNVIRTPRAGAPGWEWVSYEPY